MANPVMPDFLTLNGVPYGVLRFGRAPDEVSGAGVVARNWRATVYCPDDAIAEALYALQSHNLRRTVGWYLRGTDGADVTMAGSVVMALATVRVQVEEDEYGHADYGNAWYRLVTLLLREQVVAP